MTLNPLSFDWRSRARSRKRLHNLCPTCPPCEQCESENVIPAKTWGQKIRCVDCGHVFVDWFYDDWDNYVDDLTEEELEEMAI